MSNHNQLLKRHLNYLLENGYQILAADHIMGYAQPGQYNGQIPDIVACKDDTLFLVEVEADNSWRQECALRQLKAFSSYTDAHCQVQCHLVVPVLQWVLEQPEHNLLFDLVEENDNVTLYKL